MTEGRQQGSEAIIVNGVFRWVLSKAEPETRTSGESTWLRLLKESGQPHFPGPPKKPRELFPESSTQAQRVGALTLQVSIRGTHAPVLLGYFCSHIITSEKAPRQRWKRCWANARDRAWAPHSHWYLVSSSPHWATSAPARMVLCNLGKLSVRTQGPRATCYPEWRWDVSFFLLE